MEDRYDISVDIGEGKDWWYVHGRTTHDKVYELNRQMCDIDIPLRNPIKPLSEETAQELIGKWEKIGKEWSSKKQKIVDSIFNKIDMEKKIKKMTKAEAFEYLKSKKVRVCDRETSEKVQSKLFACGVEWKSGGKDFCDYGNYYVINSYGRLGHCDDMASYWECLIYEEISADDILSIEIVDENKSEDELVEIVELGKKIQCLLSKLNGHKHVVITEDDVILYDEGMSLFHSDPF